MDNHRSLAIKTFKYLLSIYFAVLSPKLHASFIEATIGTAVVNDATAAYFNPAALMLLKSPQAVTLYSIGDIRSTFSGKTTQINTSFNQAGTSFTQSHYHLPSLYLGVPTTKKMTLGLALVANELNKDIDEDSILRYIQSSNHLRDFDVIPAIEVKINDFFSMGAAINFSSAKFLLLPISGFPTLDIADLQSRNVGRGHAIGEDVGLLIKPSKSTLIGLNYRSALTYHLNGTSTLESNPEFVSNHYGFTFWTPARTVLSINQFVTSSLGMIATVQRIEWSIFKEVNIHGIATRIGPRSTILNAQVPYHFHDTWLVTLGSHYRITSKWIIRVASSYNQSHGNSNYQICNGDSIILGASMQYELSKNILIDTGYAHAFIQNKNIHATTPNSQINGTTHGFVNALSLKLTFNMK